jgi:hypothetical protein
MQLHHRVLAAAGLQYVFTHAGLLCDRICVLQSVLSQYKDELVDDPLINSHLSALYGTLLEQNLVSKQG